MPGASVRVLNVAEKPSVAREVAKALSGGGARWSSAGGRTGRWEFPYAIRGVPCDMSFVAVAGHLMEVEFRSPYNKWRACAPGEIFRKPTHKYVPERNANLKKLVQSEAKRAQWAMVADWLRTAKRWEVEDARRLLQDAPGLLVSG